MNCYRTGWMRRDDEGEAARVFCALPFLEVSMKSTLRSVFCVALMVLGAACASNSGGDTTAAGGAPGSSSGGASARSSTSSSGDSGGDEGTSGATESGKTQASGGTRSGTTTKTGSASASGGTQSASGSTTKSGSSSSAGGSTAKSGSSSDKSTSAGAVGSGGTPNSGTQAGTGIRARTIETRGFTFDALEAGADGEPVLLLHGFPDTSLEWSGLMPKLAAAGYHCLAPDQRGYSPGARPTEVDAYKYAELVDDAFAIASELGERFHLIGHDWGANIGWLMVQKDPSRIASFTAMSIPHYHVWSRLVYEDPKMASYLTMLNDWMVEGKGESTFSAATMRSMWKAKPSDLKEATIAHMTEPGAMTAALNWYRASDGHKRVIEDFEAWEVNVPTLLIHGSKDMGELSVTETAPLMKGPYRVARPEGEHFIVDEQPEEVAKETLAHLKAYPIK